MRLILPLSLAAAVGSVAAVGMVLTRSDDQAPPGPPQVVAADPSPVRVIPLSSTRAAPAAAIPAPAAAVAAAKAPGPASPAAAAPVQASGAPVPAVSEARAAASGPDPAPAAGKLASADPGGDVLASVGRTLADIRSAEGGPAPAPASGGGLDAGQVAALRGAEARRKVRPVTRLRVTAEVGAELPAQVYLHPAPPELAGIAPGAAGLGFAVVDGRYVVADTGSRRVVAVAAR